MTISHVQLIYLIADTLHTRGPLPVTPGQSAAPPPSRAEAVYQAMGLVGVLREVVGSPTEKPYDLIDQSQTTLKVFMAPEFYFRRPEGQQNGEDHFTRHDFIAIMGILRSELTKLLGGQPWLVTPGTVVWSTAPAGSTTKVLMNSLHGIDFTSPVQADFFCDKYYFSPIDGLHPALNAAGAGMPRPQALGYDARQVYRLHARTATGGDLWIGVEICLDHAYGILRAQEARAVPGGFPSLTLHLIVACGMDLEAPHGVVRPNGLVLRCNGNEYNNPVADGGSGEQRIRSDVYQKVAGPAGFRWHRDSRTRDSGRVRFFPPELQRRPSRPDGTLDGIGVSVVYPL